MRGRLSWALPLLALYLASSMTAQAPFATGTYLDPAAPLETRVADLVSRMTLAEKISQMQNDAPAIPRLHIAQYNWWNEGLHGVARSGYATVFPQAIGLAATWDTSLIQHVADTISTEARAKYNQALREDNHSIYFGLTIWSPNINIVRDPRWGRGQETYGEDPFLAGSIGSAFVNGLQGSDPRYLKVVSTAKHFAVHSGPESTRHTFDVLVSPHDLEDTYLPAFRQLVTGAHVDSVMCAYNAIDGAPACASDLLLQQTLKRDWRFNGFVVSDCAAITDVAVGHHFAADKPTAAAVSVLAGTDLSCGKEYAALNEAVTRGLIKESEIDEAVSRLFTARFRLGMFDPATAVPFNAIPFSEDDSAQHRELSLQTARASMVLLKNDHNALPLAARSQTIAVIGPNASALSALEGNYNAVPSHPITPLEALEVRRPGHLLYAQGSSYVEGLPVPVPPSVFSSTSDGSNQPGLQAEYFSGTTLTGTPVLQRTDRNLDVDWNAASPAAGVPANAFSVRWTGSITAPATGSIQFGFSLAHCSPCNDTEAIRVWLDGKQVYEFGHDASRGRRASTAFTFTFADTKPHPIRIEYSHASAQFGAGLTFNWQPPLTVLRDQAVEAAKKADVVIAFLGLSPEIEGEEMPVHIEGFDGGDRSAIELPATQKALVQALAATGKPLILVLMNGSAIALQDSAQKASAILEAWYPGGSGGTAIAETLFGENNPSGRLPLTFYAATSQLPAFDDYSMANRTYRYFTGTPLYGFGYGLSYTRFHYSAAHLASTNVHAGDSLTAIAELQNTGDREGTETIECYLVPKAHKGAPLQALVAFQKVKLKPGETKPIHITIDPRQLSLVDANGQRSIQPGDYELFIGGSQPSPGSGVTLPFHIDGTRPLPR